MTHLPTSVSRAPPFVGKHLRRSDGGAGFLPILARRNWSSRVVLEEAREVTLAKPATLMDDSLFRSPRPPSGPQRSLVIISRGTARELETALRAWAAPIRRGLDLVVVRRCTTAERLHLERAYPGVRVLSAPAGCDPRALRELGVSAARGDIIVVQDEAAAAACVPLEREMAMSDARSDDSGPADRAAVDLESGR